MERGQLNSVPQASELSSEIAMSLLQPILEEIRASSKNLRKGVASDLENSLARRLGGSSQKNLPLSPKVRILGKRKEYYLSDGERSPASTVSKAPDNVIETDEMFSDEVLVFDQGMGTNSKNLELTKTSKKAWVNIDSEDTKTCDRMESKTEATPALQVPSPTGELGRQLTPSIDLGKAASALKRQFSPAKDPSKATGRKKGGRRASALVSGAEKLKMRSYKIDQDLIPVAETTKGNRVRSIVVHDYFDYIMGSLLCINALTIGLQVDFMAQQSSAKTPMHFRIIDLVFCLAFVTELVLRIIAFGKHFFTMDGWKWNVFDCLIVGFSVVDETSKLILPDEETVLDSLGVLRMLRLGRILRLIRMVRLIPALKSMVYLIATSMSSFFWTGVLLVILMYCVAVYFTELATDMVHREQGSEEDLGKITEHWGSIGQSVMSLFQAITGGEDWHQFIIGFRAIDVGTYTLNMVIFALYVAFATLVMLNLVTGVFVEGAAKMAKDERQQDLVRHMKKLSKVIDKNGDGNITWNEFEASLGSKIMHDFLKVFDMDANQALDIFSVLDQDNEGEVALDAFIDAAISLTRSPKLADTEVMRYSLLEGFREIDKRLDAIETSLTNADTKVVHATLTKLSV